MKINEHDLHGTSIITLLNDIAKLFNNITKNEVAAHNINVSYANLLFYFSFYESLTQLDLVKLTHLKAPSISVTIQKMETDNIIYRKVNPNDMRQFNICLTDKGKQLSKNIFSILKVQNEKCMQGITEEEMRITKNTLNKILQNLI